MESKKTLVIGASQNPSRYSNMAIRSLLNHQIEVLALAKRTGIVEGVKIITEFPEEKVHTVTLYVNRKRQSEYYSAILKLHPERVIFNPGTENDEFYDLLKEHGIEAIEACTLLLLSTGQY